MTEDKNCIHIIHPSVGKIPIWYYTPIDKDNYYRKSPWYEYAQDYVDKHVPEGQVLFLARHISPNNLWQFYFVGSTLNTLGVFEENGNVSVVLNSENAEFYRVDRPVIEYYNENGGVLYAKEIDPEANRDILNILNNQ